jgi:hypothetical protein
MTDFKTRFSTQQLPSFFAQNNNSGDILNKCAPQQQPTETQPQTHAHKAIVVDNRKFDLNSWLTNKSFLGLITVVVLISILIIGFIFINRSNKSSEKTIKKQGKKRSDDDEDDDEKEYYGRKKVAGAGLTSNKIESQISSHSNDIKFLMAQHNQLISRIHQLEQQYRT